MHCPRCSSENPPEYRFCGMCGHSLDKPAEAQDEVRPLAPAARREKPPSNQHIISGPSFLGLNQEAAQSSFGEPSRDVQYLLDEEDVQPKRTYWRFTLLVVMLLICGGLGWLEYSQSGKAWIAPWLKQQPKTPVQASQPQSPLPSAPANGQQAQPPESSENRNSETAPTNPSGAGPAQAQSARSPTKESDLAPSPPSEKTKAAEPVETRSAEPTADENDHPSEAGASAAAAPARRVRTPKAKPTPPADNGSADDVLVANAEKALYGRGVPQNCERATSSLNAAARRENMRARALLGTMYATGHCVSRDLPTAYRWFALASRQQPNNIWVQRNLEMLWREMTPQEQQLATKLKP